jgi:tetratricopeptide (TPR) repeat protein
VLAGSPGERTSATGTASVAIGRDNYAPVTTMISTYREVPPYRLERFTIDSATMSVAQALAQPSKLLLARYAVVDFVPRDDVVDFAHRGDDGTNLAVWLSADGGRVSVRLLHGAGGQGKTRLAMHVAADRARAGWSVWNAHLAARDATPADVSFGGPALVLVDYADRWPVAHLLRLLGSLNDPSTAGGRAVRVLMLARSTGGWWPFLADDLDKQGIDATAQPLPALGEHVDRVGLFHTARQRFAERMGVADADSLTPPDGLRAPEFAQILAVHMAALAAVDAHRHRTGVPIDPQAISAYLLRREQAHWKALHEDRMATGPARMHRAVYVATLTGPVPRAQAHTALTRVRLASSVEAMDQLIDDHRFCYPPESRETVLEPMYPDLLGEDLLGLTTLGHPHEGDCELCDDWARPACAELLDGDADLPEPSYAAHAMTVLVETARRWPHVAETLLSPLMRRRPELAVTAGVATVSRLMGVPNVDVDVLAAVGEELADPDLALEWHEVAARIAERVHDHRLSRATDRAARAAVHADLGRRLFDAGRYDKARTATGNAVRIYRELYAQSGTDGAKLAMSLTALAHVLIEMDLPQEGHDAARGAIDLWEVLPGSETTSPMDVAESFTAFAMCLGALGEPQGALAAERTALELRRRLPTEDTRNAALVGAALLNISVSLNDLARWSEAKEYAAESVDAYRTWLDAGHRGGGRVGYPRALSSLATAQWELGERSSAIATTRHAVELFVEVAKLDPAKYADSLAGQVDALRSRLTDAGRLDEARLVADQAIELLRDAVLERGVAAFGEHLALLLGTRSPDEAVPVLGRVVEAYERLMDTEPARYRPKLAWARIQLGHWLWASGRDDEARACTARAVKVFEAMPDQDRARILLELGGSLAQQSRFDEGRAVAEESVQLYRRLTNENQEDYRADLAMALSVLAQHQAELKLHEEACGASQESNARYLWMNVGRRTLPTSPVQGIE